MSSAFTSLATIPIAGPSTLHQDACNPTMDLVATHSSRGKQKAKAGCRITLWRVSGSKVWDADVPADVTGLAWSPDGLILSVMADHLHHLSVHTGEIIRTLPIDGSWRMEWRESEIDWPVEIPGSALALIKSLPLVSPVEPPPTPLLFAKPHKQPPHPALAAFPCLLGTSPPPPPHILHLTSNHTSKRLLTGTFPVFNTPLAFAQKCDRIHSLLEIILRGIESLELAAKEASKQNMIWREELETCADHQGMSHAEVYADLYRLLIAGRSGVAVAEWLGNRLTTRTLAKWETTLETSGKSMLKTIAQSIAPALERVALILDDGMSDVTLACDTITLLAETRMRIQREVFAGAEWIKWLRYEIARAAAQDPSSETLPTSLHDTRLVCHFMRQNFRAPTLFTELRTATMQLLAKCQALATIHDEGEGAVPPPSLYAERLVTSRDPPTETCWVAQVARDLVLTRDGKSSAYPIPFTILAMSFFDDRELVLIISKDEGVHMITIDYPSLSTELVISRSRLLGPYAGQAKLAVNGRPGRRIGCVLLGDTLEIFDLDADE